MAVMWPAAVAPIWPLAWELPYAAGAALKSEKKKKRKEKSSLVQMAVGPRGPLWSGERGLEKKYAGKEGTKNVGQLIALQFGVICQLGSISG